ncbi:cyclic lactone autoinducer peptide [Paenibacillus oceani]|nr:cyclic lactone autoinducer peptide [Paenibacillus oceani]
MAFINSGYRVYSARGLVAAAKKGGEVMRSIIARGVSFVLERISVYFVQTASPAVTHRPEVPEQLK